MKQINKNNRIQKEQFDVEFVYNNEKVNIYRLSGKDWMDEIKTGKLNYAQFQDVCTCWCDQNAA